MTTDSLVPITTQTPQHPEKWTFSQGSMGCLCVWGVGGLAAVEKLGWPPAFFCVFLIQIGAKPSTSLEPGER